MPKTKTLIVLVGPTAIGKTVLGIEIAKYFQTEIISADSRQFYREMNIGTAKPTLAELEEIKHHFIDSHSINQLFSIGDFEVEALEVLDKVFEDSNVAVLVGGSGMYVNALLNGLDDMPEIDMAVRNNLNLRLEIEGIESIRLQLQQVDAEYFAQVDQHNPQRMIRGLEVFLSSGEKLSTLRSKTKKQRPFNVIKIGLNTDREILYQRINARVDAMMNSGLLTEVISLKDFKHFNALKTVGYNELFKHLDGEISLNQAVDAIKQNTRRFAKRQLTWVKKDEEITWFQPSKTDEVISFIKVELAKIS